MNRISNLLLWAFSLSHSASAQLTLVIALRHEAALAGVHVIEIRDDTAYPAGRPLSDPAPSAGRPDGREVTCPEGQKRSVKAEGMKQEITVALP